jgi:hypothetical protein
MHRSTLSLLSVFGLGLVLVRSDARIRSFLLPLPMPELSMTTSDLSAKIPPFVHPRVKLPRGRALEGTIMTGFEKERDRLDAMMRARSGSHISDASGGPPQISDR